MLCLHAQVLGASVIVQQAVNSRVHCEGAGFGGGLDVVRHCWRPGRVRLPAAARLDNSAVDGVVYKRQGRALSGDVNANNTLCCTSSSCTQTQNQERSSCRQRQFEFCQPSKIKQVLSRLCCHF